jgi:hypothetical protein
MNYLAVAAGVDFFLIRLYTDLSRGVELRAYETRLSLTSTLLRDQCSPPILLTIDLIYPPYPPKLFVSDIRVVSTSFCKSAAGGPVLHFHLA